MICCDSFGYVFAWLKDRAHGIPYVFRCTKCNNPRVSSHIPAWGMEQQKMYSLTPMKKAQPEPVIEPKIEEKKDQEQSQTKMVQMDEEDEEIPF